MANHDLLLLEEAAAKLGPLAAEVAFVGGAVLGLMIDDEAAAPVRSTFPVCPPTQFLRSIVCGRRRFAQTMRKVFLNLFRRASHQFNSADESHGFSGSGDLGEGNERT